MNIKIQAKIEDFLLLNGWKSELLLGTDYYSFRKENNISINININRYEVVLLADKCDAYRIPINDITTYYEMIGYMICTRMITMDFKTD